jgi:RNA polymerase sigma-70 factor, ECF subfamily
MNDEPPVQHPNPGIAPPADFATFMRNYKDMVFATSVRLVRNEAQAEDIAQEVFIKAHEHFEMLSTSPSAGGWLKTVATNLSLNHVQRYRKRWRFFSEFGRDDDEGEAAPVEFAAPDTFFESMDGEDRRAVVEEALGRLPEHQRLALVLYHYEELSYDEIFRRLGVSLAKVKTDILRARAALAKILTQGPAAMRALSN